jgi:hypothetical protein
MNNASLTGAAAATAAKRLFHPVQATPAPRERSVGAGRQQRRNNERRAGAVALARFHTA